MVSNRLQDYLPVVTQLLNQSGGSGYNYNPVAPTSVQGGIVETGTRQNPTIRPAIQVSGPNQQIPRVVGTVTNPGMVGRNQDIGAGSGMYDLNPGEKVEKGKVVSADARGGIPRALGGLADAVGGLFGQTWDFDKRGDVNYAAQGGLGRDAVLKQPTQTQIDQQVMAPDGSIYDPSTRTWSRPSAVMSEDDFNRGLSQQIRYQQAMEGPRLAQRSADFQAGLNEVKQFLPVIQEALLGARLATEAQSPSEIQSRQLQAKKGGLIDSEIARNYGAANLAWQQGTNMAPRRFG